MAQSSNNRNKTLVSFILPAYKRRFLREAIASILNQSYADFELVIVDDASPENLKEVVDEFQDPRMSYHRNEENIGKADLVAAWNKAMEYAHGEWCVLASDDDVYSPRYVEEMLKLSQRYPEVALLHCRIAAINENGGWKWIGQPRAEFETGIEMLYHCGVLRYAQRMPDLMIRRSALCDMGGFIWSPKAWMTDHQTAIALALKKGAACSREILFFWRESNENISLLLDDAEIKLHAHELHRKWIWQVINEAKPAGETEVHLLEQAKKSIDTTIDELSAWVVRRLPEREYKRILSVGEMPPGVRNRLRNELFWRKVSRSIFWRIGRRLGILLVGSR